MKINIIHMKKSIRIWRREWQKTIEMKDVEEYYVLLSNCTFWEANGSLWQLMWRFSLCCLFALKKKVTTIKICMNIKWNNLWPNKSFKMQVCLKNHVRKITFPASRLLALSLLTCDSAMSARSSASSSSCCTFLNLDRWVLACSSWNVTYD